MYQPDAIASFNYYGETFIVTANEGDARDYDGFSEEVRVEDLTLNPALVARSPGFADDDDFVGLVQPTWMATSIMTAM